MNTAVYVIGFMFSGIFLGYIFRNTKISWLQKIITFFIWLLLFLLGVHAGSNKEVVDSFAVIGIEAIIITFVAILGSCLAALALWKYLNKPISKNKNRLDSTSKKDK